MSKVINLVAGGCSFSAYEGCWPYWLNKELIKLPNVKDVNLINTARGGTGNEIISRKVIYEINKLILADVDPQDIFVSIMWSGATRMVMYSDNYSMLKEIFNNDSPLNKKSFGRFKWGVIATGPPNPEQWPRSDVKGRYFHATPASGDPESSLYNSFAEKYYKWFHNDTMALVRTYENVLRVQWYLQNLNINYIMQSYTQWWDVGYHEKRKNDGVNVLGIQNIQVEYLRKMIDWSKFTDISCHQWVTDNSKLEWTAYDPIRGFAREPGDAHPTSQQQEEYTTNYLWPLLKEKGYF